MSSALGLACFLNSKWLPGQPGLVLVTVEYNGFDFGFSRTHLKGF